jgi:serine/threonine-protein kinase RsbW
MNSSFSTDKNDKTVHRISLKNKLDELTTLSNWIQEISSHLQLSPRCAFRLELVLTEAVTNIIENAYCDDREHDIEIALTYQENTVRVQLKDDGIHFNPLERPELLLPTRLEEAQEGGLGIHLVRSYTDCREGNENVLSMIIHDSD